MELYDECKQLIHVLAEKIRESKTRNGFSTRKFAIHSMIAESTIRSIIKGSSNIELKTLVKLSLVFETDLHDLFSPKTKSYVFKRKALSQSFFEKAYSKAKKDIGERIMSLAKFRKIDPETLGILSYNINYSDTHKYIKGEINVTLLVLLKFSHGLEITISSLLNKHESLPTNKFKGKIKE